MNSYSSDDVYRHVQHFLRQIAESTMVHEVEKLIRHCREVINVGGEYMLSTVYKDFRLV